MPDERFDWDAASNPCDPGWPSPVRDNRITNWGDRRYEYDTRGRLTAKRIGEVMSTMSWAPKSVSGAIVGPCSLNVFTNIRPAARAHIDFVMCSLHPNPPPPIATGSATVFINGLPAARVGDKTGCGGDITEGSSNVFIGGGTAPTDTIQPENLVPGWVHAALFVVGVGSAVVLAGPIVAICCLAGGVVGGVAGSWIGGELWGEGSDGQKWSMLGGSFLGGFLGMKGGSALAGKAIPVPENSTQAFLKGGIKASKEFEAVANSARIIESRPAALVNAEMQAAGNQPAWLLGKNVTTEVVPTGTRYMMVVSQGQAEALMAGKPAFGGFATTENVTSQAFARDKLVILEEFKSDVSYAITVETTAPQLLHNGFTGPLGNYSGGVPQVEFLGQRNLRIIGSPWKLPLGE